MKILITSLVLALGLAAQQPPTRTLICEPSSASGTTYTCTGAPTLASYTTGLRIQFKADVANTGAVTINIDNLGAKSLAKLAGGITTDLVANDLRAGMYALAIYDGTQFQMLSQIGNVAAGSGIGTFYTSGPNGNAGSAGRVWAPMGVTPTVQNTTNWSRVAARVPAACTLKNLRVDMAVAQGSGGSEQIWVYAGNPTPSATTLTCSIATGSTSCSDLVNQPSVNAGDFIYVQDLNGSSTVNTYINVSFQCN